ncbi:MAG: serine/threonine-protein phosphatase [Rhodothermales bacterium]|nr:serine/threonine-protein phosphatase [Rhodothermales bacterium]MBO6778483.1 serine/threonine-protein phosphatase [Rhodothermales bacterium]
MSQAPETETVYEKSARFAESVFRDFSSGEIPQTLRQDLQETYDFYLDGETRERLSEMHPIKRWAFSTWYLCKNLVLKLTPTRRIILLVGVVLAIDGAGGDTTNLLLGFLALLFILGLELKDKLLAHDELEAGRVVQSALMPERRPKFSGWDIWLYTAPANDVGGDLVDCQKVDKQRFAVSLGDVSGKGLGAALFMAKLQATVRAISPSIRSLAELGARVNEIFCRDGLPGRFASLVYAELTRDAGEVRFVNAGHLPPHLVKREGVVETDKGGPAIGLSVNARYTESDLHMEPGEVLVLVSDGVTEARDQYGSFFGDDRFHRLLEYAYGHSAAEVGEQIVDAVEAFVGAARPSDDLSVAVIARRPARVLGSGPPPGKSRV